MIHSKSIAMRFLLPFIAIVAIAVGSGCAATKKATETIEAMQKVAPQYGDTHRQAQLKIAERYFETVKVLMRQSVELRGQELKVSVYERTEAVIDTLSEQAVDQLDGALADTIARLNAQLDHEKALRTSGQGNRQRELELAAQLSATLAELGKQNNQLIAKVRVDAAQLRGRALALIDDAVEEALADPVFNFSAEEEAEALMKDFHDTTRSLEAKMDNGYTQLERYVEGPRIFAKAFVEGLIGGDLEETLNDLTGNNLLESLKERGAELIEWGTMKIDAILAPVKEKAESLID